MSKKLTLSEFIERSTKIHEGKYTYEKSVYVNNSTKIIITCPTHGDFEQISGEHLYGGGCTKCGRNQVALSLTKSTKQFIDEVNVVHNGKYNYNKTVYTASKIKVIITCSIHGDFKQRPSEHLKGSGCPKCAGKSMTTEEFIIKAKIIHKNKYDYRQSDYINSSTKIIITCPIHGDFKQRPNNHLTGYGCLKCSCGISNPEIKWLDQLEIPQNYRNQLVKINNKIFKPDAVDVNNKIIYEFYGDFWHGNPEKFDSQSINPITKTTYGDLYKKTLEKELYLRNAGWKIISIWENEWENSSIKTL